MSMSLAIAGYMLFLAVAIALYGGVRLLANE